MTPIKDYKGRTIFFSPNDEGKLREIEKAPRGTRFLIGPKEYVRMLEHQVVRLYKTANGADALEGVPDTREGKLLMLGDLIKKAEEGESTAPE